MAVLVVAAGLRFYQLGQIPPGLYRDEAYNGLDAVDVLLGQRQEQSPVYFAANNGREPLYIYLTAAAIAVFGRTPFAVRLPAALIGTLITGLVYLLAASWFGRRVGLLAAWLWAVTFWPLHLSRIGLRPILLPLLLSLALWLGVKAYRRPAAGRWLLAGLAYGLGFYTYLAFRFTPLLLLALAAYLVATGRGRRLWPRSLWFGLGTLLVIAPLLILAWQQPALVLGRTDQVSILSPANREGTLPAALWHQGWQALGLFFVRGDDIWRHNLPARPLFDWLLAVPFLIGVAWCLRRWRRVAPAALLLWAGVMLGPTILTPDTPHFLRAVGVLPAALIFPALGLSHLWSWTKLPTRLGPAMVVALLMGSLALTLRDYYFVYGRQAETAYWFEDAARRLAEHINEEDPATTVLLDRRFWDSWPAVRFLARPDAPIRFYRPGEIAGRVEQPAAIYAWPYEGLESVLAAIQPPALVDGRAGELAQGDLESAPYPLYFRYGISAAPELPVLARFGADVALRQAAVRPLADGWLEVTLSWSADLRPTQALIAFVHLIGPQGLAGQDDSIPAQGAWPSLSWRPGLIVRDTHRVALPAGPDAGPLQIRVGLYDAATQERRPVYTPEGTWVGDTWLVETN